MVQKWKFVDGRVENIVGKGKDAGYQDLLRFQKPVKCYLSSQEFW